MNAVATLLQCLLYYCPATPCSVYTCHFPFYLLFLSPSPCRCRRRLGRLFPSNYEDVREMLGNVRMGTDIDFCGE